MDRRIDPSVDSEVSAAKPAQDVALTLLAAAQPTEGTGDRRSLHAIVKGDLAIDPEPAECHLSRRAREGNEFAGRPSTGRPSIQSFDPDSGPDER